VDDSERAEFDAMMDKLCAGMGVPSYDVRKEAYWQGLRKMGLIQFGRVVEHCLSEVGPDKIPAVPAVWKILNAIKAKQRSVAPQPVHARVEQSRGLCIVNGMFMKYIGHRRLIEHVRGDIAMEARRRECLDLAAWLDQAIAEDLMPSRDEIQVVFDRAMERIKDAPTPAREAAHAP
jgi:hypothetical protein